MRKKVLAVISVTALMLAVAVPVTGVAAANDNAPNATACAQSHGAANANGHALANANGNSATNC